MRVGSATRWSTEGIPGSTHAKGPGTKRRQSARGQTNTKHRGVASGEAQVPGGSVSKSEINAAVERAIARRKQFERQGGGPDVRRKQNARLDLSKIIECSVMQAYNPRCGWRVRTVELDPNKVVGDGGSGPAAIWP